MAKYLNYSAGMNLQITDSSGEEIYYRFGETIFNGSSGEWFKIAPNFKVLEMNQNTLKTKIRVFLDFVSLGGNGSGSAVVGYINGTQLQNTYTSIGKNQSRYMGSLDIEISHNQATGQGFIDVVCAVNSSWNGLGNAQSTTRIYTNTYPRGSTMGISSSTFVIGKNYSATINSNSDEFKHKIIVLLDKGYKADGTIVDNPGYVISEELYTNNKVHNTTAYAPNNFYNYLYGKKNAPGRIELTTQNSNGTPVGNIYSIPITISVDEEKDRPTISSTVTMTNYSSLTGSTETLIRGYSDVTINLTATPKNNSVIASYNISNEGKTYNANSVKFEKVSSGIFNISATDNRGLSSLVDNKEYTIVPYVKLTLNTKVYRPLQTGNEIKAKVSGNYFKDSFGKVNNTLTLKFRYCEKGGTFPNTYTTLTPTINEDNTYSGDLSLGTNFDYKKAYDFEFLISDKLESFPVQDKITNAIHIKGTFEKFFEYWGIPSFSISEDGENLIINKNILVGDTGKKLKDIVTTDENGNINVTGDILGPVGTRYPYSSNIRHFGFYTTSDGQYCACTILNPHNNVIDWGWDIWASDKRLKNSIEDTKVNALDIIKQIKHREFKYNTGDNLVKIGYVADELQEIDSEMVFEVGEKKLKQPKESVIIPILSKAIQEQQIIIENLLERIEKLENKKEE